MRVSAPESWRNPGEHLQVLINSPWYRHLAHLLSEISFATHDFFRARGARAALLPVTTNVVSSPMGLGSDSLPVRISLDGRDCYLADSMQFLLELATRFERGAAYYLMPSFRGEPVDARHLNQFFHVEAELPGGLDDVMTLVEAYVRALATHLLEKSGPAVAALAGDCAHLERLARLEHFPRLRFADAVEQVEAEGDAVAERADGVMTLTPVGERALLRRHGDFIWVTHMPWRTVPFYQARSGDCALNADLIAGVGEVVGAGQRVTGGEDTRAALRDHQVDEAGYAWYVDMKERWPLTTSGFGMGVERFLLWLTRTEDIRNCSLLLRHDTDCVP